MLTIDFEVQTLKMAKDGHELFSKYAPTIDRMGGGEVHEATPLSLGVLEDGMQSGRASVMLLGQLEVAGKVYFFMQEMSASIFKTLASGVASAEEQFEGKND